MRVVMMPKNVYYSVFTSRPYIENTFYYGDENMDKGLFLTKIQKMSKNTDRANFEGAFGFDDLS